MAYGGETFYDIIGVVRRKASLLVHGHVCMDPPVCMPIVDHALSLRLLMRMVPLSSGLIIPS